MDTRNPHASKSKKIWTGKKILTTATEDTWIIFEHVRRLRETKNSKMMMQHYRAWVGVTMVQLFPLCPVVLPSPLLQVSSGN